MVKREKIFFNFFAFFISLFLPSGRTLALLNWFRKQEEFIRYENWPFFHIRTNCALSVGWEGDKVSINEHQFALFRMGTNSIIHLNFSHRNLLKLYHKKSFGFQNSIELLFFLCCGHITLHLMMMMLKLSSAFNNRKQYLLLVCTQLLSRWEFVRFFGYFWKSLDLRCS